MVADASAAAVAASVVRHPARRSGKSASLAQPVAHSSGLPALSVSPDAASRQACRGLRRQHGPALQVRVGNLLDAGLRRWQHAGLLGAGLERAQRLSGGAHSAQDSVNVGWAFFFAIPGGNPASRNLRCDRAAVCGRATGRQRKYSLLGQSPACPVRTARCRLRAIATGGDEGFQPGADWHGRGRCPAPGWQCGSWNRPAPAWAAAGSCASGVGS